MTFDRLVNYHRLNNLIWVWNANAPNGKNPGPYYDYYPGAQYVDIHDDLVELAAGKPIALGEIGRPPSLEVLKASRSGRGSWGRRNIFDRQATDAHKALFSDPRTLSRGDKLPEPQP